MMQGEKVANDLRETQKLCPVRIRRCTRSPPPRAGWSGAARRRATLVEPAVRAIDAASMRWKKRASISMRRCARNRSRPAELERIEERLFALRAASRKYSTPVDRLAELAARNVSDLALIDAGADRLKALEKAAAESDKRYRASAEKLSAARTKAAEKLNKAVNAELGPLKLERANSPRRTIPTRTRRVRKATTASSSGCRPIPARGRGPADESRLRRRALAVSSGDQGCARRQGLGADAGVRRNRHGVGGAVADAIGARLARLADKVQVMAVTHAPQVAARADQHLLISKDTIDKGKRVATRVAPLEDKHRREEIARMLAGAESPRRRAPPQIGC